jgi:hypothetical protein
MRFEETKQRREKRRIGETVPQLVGPDSGQVDEALRPTVIAERCGQRSERQRDGIIWYPKGHGLEDHKSG